jgi:hypothetical protein
MPPMLDAIRNASSDRSMRDLGAFLFHKMQSADSSPAEVARQAAAGGASQTVIDELNKKTSSPTISSSVLSVPLGLALERAIALNAPRAAFDVMKPFMLEVPLRSRVIINSSSITGASAVEAAAKPVRRLNLSNLDTELTKSIAQVAMSKELLDEAPQLAQVILTRALPEAVGRATDTFLLSRLNANNSGESSGDASASWAQMLADLTELLEQVQAGDASKLFFIMPPRIAKALSGKAYENGVVTAKYNGGEILGVPILTTLGQTSGVVTIVDASALAIGDEGFSVRTSDVANLELSDTPTGDSAAPTAVSTVSAFQVNMRAILCERRVSVRIIDPNAVASLTGIQWGPISTDSPMNA